MLVDERALIAEGIDDLVRGYTPRPEDEMSWTVKVVELYLDAHGIDDYELRQGAYGLICYTSEEDFIKLNGLRPQNWPYKDKITRHGVIWTTKGKFPEMGEKI